MPTVVLDVDGPCLDLMTAWLRRFSARTGHHIEPHQATSLDIRDDIVAAHHETVMEMLQDPELYDDVQPVAGAVAGVRTLREFGFDIVFASTCTFGMADQKARCLERHGFLTNTSRHFLPPEFMAVARKDLISADVLIEDNHENAVRWCERQGGLCILVDYPYNRRRLNPMRGVIERTQANPEAWSSIIKLVRRWL